MSDAQEKWGCWDGQDEHVSAIADSKEAAIEKYAKEYVMTALDSETESCQPYAEVSLGRRIVVEDYLPSFDDFVENLDERILDNVYSEDSLITLSNDNAKVAEVEYDKMMKEFAVKHVPLRAWYTFEKREQIIVKIVNGQYVGWEATHDVD